MMTGKADVNVIAGCREGHKRPACMAGSDWPATWPIHTTRSVCESDPLNR